MKPALIIVVSLFAASLSCQTATTSLKRCAAIDDPVERLACYDKLAGCSPAETMKARGTAPEVVDPAADTVVPTAPAATPTVPAVEPKPDVEAAFGLKHGQTPNKDRTDELKFKWARKKKDAHGKWVIILENGQVWRQTDTRRLIFENSEHWVIISRGFGGGFFLKEPGSKLRIRVKRVK